MLSIRERQSALNSGLYEIEIALAISNVKQRLDDTSID